MSTRNQGAYVTSVLLCVFWLILFYAAPTVTHLNGWHTNFILTPDSSYFALLTTHFFHVDGHHLLTNIAMCLGLMFFLKDLISNVRFAALWLSCGPIATTASFIMEPGALVGASGGLMGVLGGALALVPMAHQSSQFRLLIGILVVGSTVALPGDAVAHVSGLLVGYGFTKSNVDPKLMCGIVSLVSVFGLVLLRT